MGFAGNDLPVMAWTVASAARVMPGTGMLSNCWINLKPAPGRTASRKGLDLAPTI
jgi:hypothetical protein